ncbi:hypothetical protein BJ166DRAFT_611324 [Pestalotiopsis sp. NC0098]|nr:hypothetical protein BJ166DRAFT_611324 [Pestalotiopsis sp. NC0098]
MRPATALVVGLLASRAAASFLETFLCVAVAAATAPFIAISMLNCCGFGTLGIAAGSIAAYIHSLIGVVAAWSPFAILQSAGMGGYGVFIVKFVASAVGGIIALLLRLFR